MLNSPKQIEAEKVRMAQKEKEKEKEEKEKEAKATSKANSINGTGGTPIHVNTLQVSRGTHATLSRFKIRTGRGLNRQHSGCEGSPTSVTSHNPPQVLICSAFAWLF